MYKGFKAKVYLLQRTPNTKTTFIRTTRPSDKLDFAKLGSFRIIKALGPVTYKLNLPNSIRITKIQHISVLKLVDPKTLLVKDIPDINSKSQKKVWEIKKILNINLMNNN